MGRRSSRLRVWTWRLPRRAVSRCPMLSRDGPRFFLTSVILAWVVLEGIM